MGRRKRLKPQQFQRGHPQFKPATTLTYTSPARIFSRLPKEIYNKALDESKVNIFKITDLKSPGCTFSLNFLMIYDLALHFFNITFFLNQFTFLLILFSSFFFPLFIFIQKPTRPSILRPGSKTADISDQYLCAPEHELHATGNRIFFIQSLEDALTSFLYQHTYKNRKKCTHPAVRFFDRKQCTAGLASNMLIACARCDSADGPYILHRQATSLDERTPKGPKTCALQRQIALYSFKSDTSFESIQLLLSILELPSITKSNFYDHKAKLAPIICQLANDAVSQNRTALKVICEHADIKTGITAMTDTVYSSPPKGRFFNCPATQSCTTAFEAVTPQRMLIDIRPYSQLCPIEHAGSKCYHEKCGLNLESKVSIASTERIGAAAAFHSCHSDGLTIANLVHDGIETSSHQCGMRDAAREIGVPEPQSSACIAHLSRNTSKQVFKCSLSQQMLRGRPAEHTKKFKAALGKCLST